LQFERESAVIAPLGPDRTDQNRVLGHNSERRRQEMEGRSFERFGAVCAALAGVAGFGYSTAFVIYLHNGARGAVYADSVLLIVGGLLSAVTFIALYGRLRKTDEGFALLGAALLVFIYVGRLVILNPRSPALHAAAVLSGFIVNPAWFIWLGSALWKRSE
jgi:hypothetical protein